jgi:hypothetical protein
MSANRGPRGAVGLRAVFEAREPLIDVGEEARLALLAVADHVHADLVLAAHNLSDLRGDAPGEGLLVVGLACLLGRQHLEEVVGAGEAAAVGGQDALGTQLHLVLQVLGEEERREAQRLSRAAIFWLVREDVKQTAPSTEGAVCLRYVWCATRARGWRAPHPR